MKAPTAKQIIRQEYNGSRNFMTPHIIKYGKMCRNIAYELSSGQGFNREAIFGVSVVMIDESTGETERLCGESHMFQSLADALDYIDGRVILIKEGK